MKKQKQYYINGLILIVIALITITVVPLIADKYKIGFEKSSFSEFEFFILTAAALFYLFSPKYYKWQFISIVCGILYYLIFLKIYPHL